MRESTLTLRYVTLVGAVLCLSAFAVHRTATAEPAGATASDVKPAAPTSVAPTAATMTRELYLDRLMLAESGGRDDAKNPRSTAVGPYQFIVGTFLSVTRRYFPTEVANLSDADLLAKRTDRAFARRAADAYTNDCANELTAAGLSPTYANLRLAFLLGPSGAIRVLKAPAETPMASLVTANVMTANPFLGKLTAAGLIARAARDIGVDASGAPVAIASMSPAPAAGGKPRPPAIAVKCDLDRASCRRWLSLAQQKAARPKAIAARWTSLQ